MKADPPTTASARTIWQRLRPFVRRDLKGRLISAAIAASVIVGLCHFAVLAFTKLDGSTAKDVRVQLGLEARSEVCQVGSSEERTPLCTFDDRSQDVVDRNWRRDREIRAAIYHDLDLRIEAKLDDFARAERLLERESLDFTNGLPAGGHVELAALLELPNLRPLAWQSLELADGSSVSDPLAAATYDSMRDGSGVNTQTIVLEALVAARKQLLTLQNTVARQRARDLESIALAGTDEREVLIKDIELAPNRMGLQSATVAWFQYGHADEVSRTAMSAARHFPLEFDEALDADAAIWAGGWDAEAPEWRTHYKPRVRYVSPITDEQRWSLLGTLLLGLATFVFLVVGPVVSATATAREREAGTLPVLRMTGLSAKDLALAMILGANVFALALGGALLIGGVAALSLAGQACSLVVPLAVLAFLAATTHVSAIALGDALGQRVNAMVVGALVGVVIMVPGLIGTAFAGAQVSATGLLLGPLPAPLALFADLGGVSSFGIALARLDDLGSLVFAYSLAIQGVLAVICMVSWRRRIEQGWAPLFRPLDGIALALASIGCSALTLLEVSGTRGTEDFETLNALTFMANVFLLPLLGWLLVASLRRPARARAVASHIEARRGFLRFQGFMLATATAVGATYYIAMTHAGLATDKSELMVATLGQVVLLAETSVAVLLWAARRREHKLRVAFLGGTVVFMQLGALIGTYLLEVEHVARTNSGSGVLLMGVEVSPYWLAFLVMCWATGIALILTALHRSRDTQRGVASSSPSEASEESPAEDEDEDEGLPGRRLIH